MPDAVRRGDFGLAITNKALAGDNKRALMGSRITHLPGGLWFPRLVPTPLRRRASQLLRGSPVLRFSYLESLFAALLGVAPFASNRPPQPF